MHPKTHVLNLQTTIKLKGLEPDNLYTNKETGEQFHGLQLMQFGVQI
jgi:hypothetical protein